MNPNARPTERFSNRVENYAKYRPGYPPEILDCLRRNCGFTPSWVVADIGSGTGLLSELFLSAGNRLFGVEPNPDMRRAGEACLRDCRQFVSVAGKAEATNLAAGSVDLIAAGQAFHWFDRHTARPEFERILKPGGWVAIIWNERLTSTPFLRDYEQLLLRYSGEYPRIDHRNVTQRDLEQFFNPGRFQTATFSNQQVFDWDGLRGRALSSSYTPVEGQDGHVAMMREMEEIFKRRAENGSVIFEYETKMYYGQFV